MALERISPDQARALEARGVRPRNITLYLAADAPDETVVDLDRANSERAPEKAGQRAFSHELEAAYERYAADTFAVPPDQRSPLAGQWTW